MKARAQLGLVVIACTLGGVVAGCDSNDSWGYGVYTDNEIVFGIEQSKATDGTPQTSVGYEYLDVFNKGWSAVGLVSRGESCWAETLDDRVGQPHVEGGVATFTGGTLPANGIAVVANRTDDLVLPTAAWTGGGSPLTFTANGFAMPTIPPATVYAPTTDLAVLTPADPTADVAIDGTGTKELGFTWTPSPDTDGPHENVVVSINAIPASTPNARGVELRCFFDKRLGSGSFPQDLVQQFASLVDPDSTSTTPITGKLHIATHRQLTIHADGGWTVYVVASVDQREQTFTLSR